MAKVRSPNSQLVLVSLTIIVCSSLLSRYRWPPQSRFLGHRPSRLEDIPPERPYDVAIRPADPDPRPLAANPPPRNRLRRPASVRLTHPLFARFQTKPNPPPTRRLHLVSHTPPPHRSQHERLLQAMGHDGRHDARRHGPAPRRASQE